MRAAVTCEQTFRSKARSHGSSGGVEALAAADARVGAEQVDRPEGVLGPLDQLAA
jgi:hypothetical protein